MRIDKNIIREVVDVNKENAFEMAKTMNAVSFDKIGRPFTSLWPPGTLIEAANAIVTMSAATIVHEFAVCHPFLSFHY